MAASDGGPVDGADYERNECPACDGSGRDPDEWDGRCIYCGGSGEVVGRGTDDDDSEEGVTTSAMTSVAGGAHGHVHVD